MKSLSCEGQKGRDRISPVCYLGYFLHQEGKSCRVPEKDCPVPLGRLTVQVSWLISVVLLDFVKLLRRKDTSFGKVLQARIASCHQDPADAFMSSTDRLSAECWKPAEVEAPCSGKTSGLCQWYSVTHKPVSAYFWGEFLVLD